MKVRLHRVAYSVFGRLPQLMQTFIVHRVSPSYSLGSLVVLIDDGQVLLVSHSYKPQWGLPGGITKRGEAPEAAARRELLEEVGASIDLIGAPVLDIEVNLRKVDAIFAASLSAGASRWEVRPMSPEIDRCEWFPLDDLPTVQREVTAGLTLLRQAGLVSGR